MRNQRKNLQRNILQRENIASKFVLVAVIATLFAGSQIFAQGAFVGPVLGLYKATSADEMNIMGGAALRLKLMPGLGVEGSINYRSEDYAGGRVTARSWPVMVRQHRYRRW